MGTLAPPPGLSVHSLVRWRLSTALCAQLACGLAVGMGACGPESDSGESAPAYSPEVEFDPNETGGDAESNHQGTVPLGYSCLGDLECESGHCKEMFGQGICSECPDDAQCQMDGEGLNCAYSVPDGWAQCMEGDLGQDCEEHGSCKELYYCARSLLSFELCSECVTDEHCTSEEATLCSPIFDWQGDLGPYRFCTAPGSLTQNALCDPVGSGEEACEGHCVALSGLEDGLCGECRPGESDCGEAGACSAPKWTNAGFLGSVCQ